MSENKKTERDLDLQIRVRSSTEDSKELERITSLIAETLIKDLRLALIEKNLIVNQNVDRKLITVTVTFQAQ